jgi:L-lysine 2,3-aminomutase
MTLSWQEQLAQSISSVDQLYKYLDLDMHLNPEFKNLSQAGANQFKIKVPLAFAQRIEKGNPQDPLLLQVLAQPQEQLETPGYCTDPLAEKNQKFNPLPGLLHKYHGRVLLMLHGTCAIHCR